LHPSAFVQEVPMSPGKPTTKLDRILCPSDLSEKSQKVLGFATRLSETLNAELTACHCAPATWFTAENRLSKDEYKKLRSILKEQIVASEDPSGNLHWSSIVIENSFDPATDILALARESSADLIVMKARPGILSAFRFGSIVERIVENSPCPVLLLPSSFLAKRDPRTEPFEFQRILFDYDSSKATDELFKVANTMTHDYHAELHVLSVLKPMFNEVTEAAPVRQSRTSVQTIIRRRLDEALHAEGRSVMDVPTSVEWGGHAETVLSYAKAHQIDLICTTLAPAHFYFEKIYSTYLGSLLKSATCPILVKHSPESSQIKDFS
jgi:nucleotide-binding universal stress UspA family protein